MSIQLSVQQIESAIPKVAVGLRKYQWIQAQVAGSETFWQDAEFRRGYNHFYRVRRNSAWRDEYFLLMGRAKRKRLRFDQILDQLHVATGRYEASFASKLFATLNPTAPVIDSVVLSNVKLRLPSASVPDRAARICTLYGQLRSAFSTFLITQAGRYLVRSFRLAYPDVSITEEKMLDLVLWQTRAK